MGRTFYFLVIGGIVLFAGIALFPGIHTILNQTDTTGMPDLLKVVTTGLPYILIFFIGYIVYQIVKGRTQ